MTLQVGAGTGRRAVGVRVRTAAAAAVIVPLAALSGPARAATPALTTPAYLSSIQQPGGVPPLAPNALAFSASGIMYASDQAGQRIVSVDPATGGLTEVSPASAGWSHVSGLALEADQQHMWVADKDNNRVAEFSLSTGQITRTIGGFNAPETLMLYGSDLIVADTYNYRVVRVNLATAALTWAQSTCNGTKLLRMRGLTLGSDGMIYVADTDQAQVVVLDPASGSCLRAFGSHGVAPGKFAEPRGIAADGSGGLWVAENGNARIQHVSQAGQPIWLSATTFGSGPNQFRSPHDVEIVTTTVGTTLYIPDTYDYRIAVYTQNPDGSATFDRYIAEPPPTLGGFNGPYGLAYDPAGDLYVVDHFNSRVEKFNPDRTFNTWWGGEGVPQGSFNFPRGILVEPSGDVMVCDSENHRMQTFSSQGVYISSLQPHGTLPFLRPEQITLGPDGSLWAADTHNNRVINVTMSGQLLHAWPAGSKPVGIALDSAQNVYVSAGSGVKRYSTTGNLLGTLASPGTGPNQVHNPDGLVVSGTTLYIADAGNDRVVEMTTAGVPILTFGSLGSGDGQFNQPLFVALGPNGMLAVSDYGNNRVSLWQA